MTLVITLEPAPIETDPQDVMRVAKTHVTLDTIVTTFLEGCTPEKIGEQYPSLQLPDIYLLSVTTLDIEMRCIPTLKNVSSRQI